MARRQQRGSAALGGYVRELLVAYEAQFRRRWPSDDAPPMYPDDADIEFSEDRLHHIESRVTGQATTFEMFGARRFVLTADGLLIEALTRRLPEIS
ncbi:hypothetical protein [uncultured Gordonia sp.]|jgi:hypothetical protein|uniref:hypothetical protein n=1 Tax=uncultured Gordonia sp. TaxID=198437 RepID=UPI002623B195|nr:hypothetical protein [uncultured Gordonia sp.]